MSQPVQHHYLPKNAHLRFFESPEKAGFVWMYQRGEMPIFANVDKVAKERHLYSFRDDGGEYNTEIESAFAEMEGIAGKVLEKFNNAEAPISISVQEKSDLSYFLAMQFARTPAFRDLLKEQTAEFIKLNMKALASNEKAFAHAMEQAKKEKPDLPDLSRAEMKEFILGEKYRIDLGNENYFLKQTIQVGDHIYPSIMMKDIFILKSKVVEYITSDYPVSLIPDPEVPPFYGGGFLMSGVVMPIGTNTALFLRNPNEPKNPLEKDEQILVGYKEPSPAHSRWINRLTINGAERFLFGASSDEKIKEIFDKTTVPKRFSISSPFSRNKN